MVLPTQFNVNPPLFFFPVREELPVSVSIHSSRRDRQQVYSPIWIWGINPRQKKKKERERGTGGVFDGEGASGYRLKPDLTFEDIQLVLKGYNNNKNVAPSGEESSKSPLLIAFLF